MQTICGNPQYILIAFFSRSTQCDGVQMRDDGSIFPDTIRERHQVHRLGARQLHWSRVCLLVQVSLISQVVAGPLFDTGTPSSFFTNVASRLLSTELNVNLSQMEIYPTNQYTPPFTGFCKSRPIFWMPRTRIFTRRSSARSFRRMPRTTFSSSATSR